MNPSNRISYRDECQRTASVLDDIFAKAGHGRDEFEDDLENGPKLLLLNFARADQDTEQIREVVEDVWKKHSILEVLDGLLHSDLEQR